MRILLLTLILSCTSYTYAQLSIVPKVFDSILGDVDSKLPGYSAIIVHKGEIVYQREQGYSNIGNGTLNSSSSPFDIASIGKQFTAMCILLLEEEGKLTTSDPITDYLPDFPNIRTKITIDNLLGHSSGIRSYLLENTLGESTLFCIGNTTASEAQKHSKNIIVANKPTVENVLVQAINNYKHLW